MTDLQRPSEPRLPRWVKGLLIAGLVVVLLAIALLLGGHSPRGHLS